MPGPQMSVDSSIGRSIEPNGAKQAAVGGDLERRRPEVRRGALIVVGAHRNDVHAVQEPGRVDVRREARVERARVRAREVRECGVDVGARRAEGRVSDAAAPDGRRDDAAVHEEVDVIDVAVVERPAEHGLGAVGRRRRARRRGRQVEVAERRLIDRVVHRDRDRPEDRRDRRIGRRHGERQEVSAVGVVARAERCHPAGSRVVGRVGREGRQDVDAREVGDGRVSDGDAVHEKVDAGDGARSERPAPHGDDAGYRLARLRPIDDEQRIARDRVAAIHDDRVPLATDDLCADGTRQSRSRQKRQEPARLLGHIIPPRI